VDGHLLFASALKHKVSGGWSAVFPRVLSTSFCLISSTSTPEISELKLDLSSRCTLHIGFCDHLVGRTGDEGRPAAEIERMFELGLPAQRFKTWSENVLDEERRDMESRVATS